MSGSRLKAMRTAAGLTQVELAARAGVSRQLIGALEAGRHLPRVDAALALASALGVEVADLFSPARQVVDVVSGLRPATGTPVRIARVGDILVSAPARIGADGWDVADGVMEESGLVRLTEPGPGIVVAGCEPALETIEHLLRHGGSGAVAAASSSASAIAALAAGRVHAAVVHGPEGRLPVAPTEPGIVRFRLASWRVGLALPDDIEPRWWNRVRAGELPVVQGQPGAMVQSTFEEATGKPRLPGPRVSGHVAASRHGLAAGLPALTIEPAAVAIGARFHSLDVHRSELWVGAGWMGERVVEEALGLVASGRFRDRLRLVGGYDLDGLGTRAA